jgi:type II secretory pathway pseudopilin PulG
MMVGQTCRSAVKSWRRGNAALPARPACAFTLIEVMVVVTLLAFIVIALMAVFNSTQAAFRASVTQSDVLEGGRAVMDLMTGDLKEMAAANLTTNGAANANFWVGNYGYPPLTNSLVGSGNTRSNILENFFILSSGNQNGVPTWYGTGYAVTNASNGALYSLYRFSTNHPMASSGAVSNLFFRDFENFLSAPANYSHLIDGVVGLRIHAFDTNGAPINAIAASFRTNSLLNIPSEVGYVFYSNALPASVEIEMDTLEDRTLQRAESLKDSPTAQMLYLVQQAGKIHVFRQRVSIPNVDPAAYQ